MPDDISLKNDEILMAFVIKEHGKFYSQTLLQEAFFPKKVWDPLILSNWCVPEDEENK